MDIVTVASALLLVVFNFVATRAFSNHLVIPNRVMPSTRNEATLPTTDSPVQVVVTDTT